ncbi:MAG: site-specific DNA-methyltransferase [Rickettsiales bacterium]
MQNLLEDLKTLLKEEPAYLAAGELLKNVVVEDALKLAPRLLRLLRKNETALRHFFADVDGIVVFDKAKFHEFVSNKAFLPDSYTAFKNKIGLTVEDKFLKSSNDVVLSWAYKDCVLEGGMRKEDDEGNVEEIFYNEILAPDEITRLTDLKALTGFEYWDSKAIEHGKAVAPESITKNDNLLIKGNNLLALHCLVKRYAGEVKLIYIDPPYNTEDDSFRYNDTFSHSTWLTFMKNRLEAAKELLSQDGFIFVQIGDTMQPYLQLLMDEIFGKDKFQTSIIVKMSHLSGPKMAHIDKKIPKIKEHILMYSNSENSRIIPEYIPSSWEDAFDRYASYIEKNNSDDPNDWTVETLNYVLKKNGLNEEKNPRECLEFKIKNSHLIFRTARNRGADYSFYPKERITEIAGQKGKFTYKHEDVYLASYKMRDFNGARLPSSAIGDIWNDISLNNLSNEGGISLRNGKKPEALLRRIISMTTEKNDLVLDFFSGSGTTCSVAHKMGRRWIAVEQMDYIKDLPEARLKNVIAGDKTGISKSVNWQGGGSFIFCKIMEWNERYIQEIRKAHTTQELLAIYDRMKPRQFSEETFPDNFRDAAFLRYDFDPVEWDGCAFVALSFEDQKNALLELLDKNHLYVNYSEIDDIQYGVSETDKRLSASFYGK